MARAPGAAARGCSVGVWPGRRLPRRGSGWRAAELLVSGQRVDLRPDLGDAPALDPKDVDPRPGRRAARREVLKRSILGPGRRIALHYMVVLNDEEVEVVAEIGEGRKEVVHH